jgi:hypothetical protein
MSNGSSALNQQTLHPFFSVDNYIMVKSTYSFTMALLIFALDAASRKSARAFTFQTLSTGRAFPRSYLRVSLRMQKDTDNPSTSAEVSTRDKSDYNNMTLQLLTTSIGRAERVFEYKRTFSESTTTSSSFPKPTMDIQDTSSVSGILNSIFNRVGSSLKDDTGSKNSDVASMGSGNTHDGNNDNDTTSQLLTGSIRRAEQILEYKRTSSESTAASSPDIAIDILNSSPVFSVLNDILQRVGSNVQASTGSKLDTASTDARNKDGYSKLTLPLLATSIGGTKRVLEYKRTFSKSAISSSSPDVETDVADPSPVSGMLNNILHQARSNLETDVEAMNSDTALDNTSNPLHSKEVSKDDTASKIVGGSPPPPPPIHYRDNPLITSTALAQILWSHIVRPGIDSAIDATCGNGHDSAAIAQLLFPGPDSIHQSQLLCLDIQESACTQTRRKLETAWSDRNPSHSMDAHIQVLTQSHAPLPLPRNYPTTPLALVVYNLGYLPHAQSDTKEYHKTHTTTTLHSLADAACALRIGGLLSVLTYPATNPEEDVAVRTFLRGLAWYSSHSHDWRQVGEEGDDLEGHHRQTILEHLQRIYLHNGAHQTWRVYEHVKIGWDNAPILVTAMRLK